MPITNPAPNIVVKVIIPNLEEYVYSFSVVAYDNEGNKSIATEINNVRVFGNSYRATLLNRGVNESNPYQFLPDGSLQLNFNRRDTMNVSTTIQYTNTSGETKELELLADDNSIVVPNYQAGTTIRYRSSYIPEEGSIDVFNVTAFSDFPTIIGSIRDKLFALPAETKVHTGHGDGTTIGTEAPHLEEWIRAGS